MATDPVPATSSPLIPMLVCRNVGAQLEFCTTVFDAVEVSRRPGPDGNVVHALIKIGDAMVIIEGEWQTLTNRAPQEDGTSPVVIFLYVKDVDAVARRAQDAGATILAHPRISSGATVRSGFSIRQGMYGWRPVASRSPHRVRP